MKNTDELFNIEKEKINNIVMSYFNVLETVEGINKKLLDKELYKNLSILFRNNEIYDKELAEKLKKSIEYDLKKIDEIENKTENVKNVEEVLKDIYAILENIK